jgi:DNA-binding transcriptional ArsR family regulator
MTDHGLLGPRSRRQLLARLYGAPDREFYLRELVRLTGLAPRTVQVELDWLVAAALVVERRSGNRRYLRANVRHPLFRPLYDIVARTDGLAAVLAGALGTDGIAFGFVFGSMASGLATAGSDVDLLVVGNVGLREVVRRLSLIQEAMGREINPVVWTRAEFERRRAAKDAFLARVMAGPRLAVVGEVDGS